ncbi:hypothetical protein CRG98_010212 [Punica granatum]|uniref:Uncharacterized protein n=1 Tax=Punica granatum TaxID=22663 RepID=A0A2I0KLP9_PUNGR|nr:hypothetical protein CRG98_010212 [Punica granatum]
MAKHRRRPELSPASIPAVVAASRGENSRPRPRRCRCPPIPATLRLTGLGPRSPSTFRTR